MKQIPLVPQPQLAYWSLDADKALAQYDSSPNGLSQEQVADRQARYGLNVLKPRKRSNALTVFFGQFRNSIVVILLIGTVISAATQDWSDALIILAIVLGSALLSFVQEFSAGNAVERLRAQVQIKTNVLRAGVALTIPAEEVVPGDIVSLSTGALAPADGLVLEARDLFLSQAVLTGETFPVEKRVGVVAASASLVERENSVYMGTNVRSGAGRMLVTQTGRATALGAIADRLTLRPPETDFERGLRNFGHLLAQIMLVLVIVIFATNVLLKRPVLDSLLFSVALAVGLTPQLLPAITTITLSRGAQAMSRRGVIVKRLASIENFGSMDVLCTDKTGTITKGVVHLDAALDASGEASAAVGRWAYLNATLQTGLANPLDEAIRAGLSPDVADVIKLDEVPYDFQRKRLSVVVQDGQDVVLITKGALDTILQVCAQVWLDGAVAPLDDARRDELQRRFAEWSGQGYRVLGLASKQMIPLPHYGREVETGLTFQGFLLFFDPPKEGIVTTINALADLGVALKIISGDNRLVALHTAETIGLAVEGVLTGAQIDDTKDEALWHLAEHTTLFVEVDPNQKERIILSLKKMGHVVGYMGDGINDAPALHAADVGISVDGAVDVAKEAADLVLQRSDLEALIEGIRQGRQTFANTLKYIFVTTSANFGNMLSMAGASLFLPFLPMLPKQILLTNFLTDFPAMNIAGDLVDPEWTSKPHRWNMTFIRNFMITFGAVSSVFDYLTFALLLWVLQVDAAQFQTGWFLESVLTELLILLIIRTQRPFWKSRAGRGLSWAIAAVVVLTAALPFSPLRHVLGFAVLPWPVVAVLAPVTVLYLGASELAKRWFYKRAVW